jgi:branched-subunit amino acid transport protein
VTTWIVMLGVGAGSFAFRLGPLLAFRRVSLGERGDRAIRNAGTSAITALIVVSVKQNASGTATVPTLLAMVAAVLLAGRGASMARLLVSGGAIYAGAVVVTRVLAR